MQNISIVYTPTHVIHSVRSMYTIDKLLDRWQKDFSSRWRRERETENRKRTNEI